jgi:hypothetical protein
MLREILIPPAVKRIEDGAFVRCSQLTIANLGEGLEKIGDAVGDCASLHKILIPPIIKPEHICHEDETSY